MVGSPRPVWRWAPPRRSRPRAGFPKPAATPPPPRPTALFNNAVTAFGNGDYQGALTAIDNLLKQIPADLPAPDKAKLNAQLEPIYFTRGAAYFNLKQYSEAITALKDYLARYPKSTRVNEATFSLAQASFFDKDYPTAAKGFATLENVPAFREQALMLEGLSYREANDNAKAIGALEKLTASGIRSATTARGAMQLVLLYSKNKQPDKALAMLSNVQANVEFLENVEELNAVALEQGDAYLQNNQNKEALTCYRAVRTREQVIALERGRIAALQKQLDANKLAARTDPKQAMQFLTANKQLLDAIAEDQARIDAYEKLPTIYPKVLYRVARAFYQLGRPWESIVAYGDGYDRSTDPADREPALFGEITALADVNQSGIARDYCNSTSRNFPRAPTRSPSATCSARPRSRKTIPRPPNPTSARCSSNSPTVRCARKCVSCSPTPSSRRASTTRPRTAYSRYQSDFPQGAHVEEAFYRVALANLFAGNYDEALKGVEAYLSKYPSGNFASDAKYRREVCRYAMNKYDDVIAGTKAWLKQYPGDPQQGEVEALLGDALTAKGDSDGALDAYQTSFKTATTDEVLNYSINEAGKILQKKGDWEADATMFADFVKAKPDSPTAVYALSQIGRAKAKLGKVDEAKQFLADTLKKYIDDPRRDSVEQILDQLASLCVRKKPSAAALPPRRALALALAGCRRGRHARARSRRGTRHAARRVAHRPIAHRAGPRAVREIRAGPPAPPIRRGTEATFWPSARSSNRRCCPRRSSGWSATRSWPRASSTRPRPFISG